MEKPFSVEFRVQGSAYGLYAFLIRRNERSQLHLHFKKFIVRCSGQVKTIEANNFTFTQRFQDMQHQGVFHRSEILR